MCSRSPAAVELNPVPVGESHVTFADDYASECDVRCVGKCQQIHDFNVTVTQQTSARSESKINVRVLF